MARMFGLLVLCSVVAAAYAGCGTYGADSTMCKTAADCGSANGGACGPVSDADIAKILKVHNDYRNDVAQGKELRGKPGPQPKGADIRELKWNPELAKFAQRWAEQLVGNPHDTYANRKVSKFLVGQNVYMTGFQDERKSTDWQAAVKSWYEEVVFVKGSDFTAQGGIIGHYTQVLWGETYEIGCGVYGDNKKCTWTGWDKFNCQKYVCNYGPAGNMGMTQPDGSVKQNPVYTSTPCATKSKAYPFLCA